MQTPTYAKDQFIDDTLLNGAAALVAADFMQMNNAAWQSGLFYGGTLAVSTNALVATITASLPFQVMFTSGVLASAHGTTVGQDSQLATVDFTGVVPSSGSQLVYLAVAAATVQQGPQPLIGPPPGHPDYNPAFVPGTTYTDTVDSLIFFATTVPPDQNTTFEIARCTLSAAATGLPALDFRWQRSSAIYGARSTVPFFGSVTVNIGTAGATYVAVASGIITLPPASTNNGMVWRFASATSASVLVQAQGSDLIYGSAGNPSAGVGSLPLVQGSAIEVMAILGTWQITGGTSSAQGGGAAVPPGTVFDFAGGTVPAGYLLCDGQAVSRSGYAALFAAIGTAYGAGDGSSTFNLPDLRGCVVAGLDNMGGTARGVLPSWNYLGAYGGEANHLLTSAEIPAHTHYFSATTATENQAHNHNFSIPLSGGGGVQPFGGTNTPAGGPTYTTGTENQAHNHNVAGYTDGGQVGGGYHNNVQPTVAMNKIIKW